MRWALGDEQGAGNRRARLQARDRPAGADRSHARSVRSHRRHALRAGRTGAVGAAGTPLAEIEALLDTRNQELAFEPMDYGPLLGGAAGQRHHRRRAGGQSVRARAASRRAPRAIISSASRRSPGRGETFKSGGRVVKNVTGYDLCKLMAGSWGTLARDDRRHDQGAAASRRPRATVIVRGLDDARAVRGDGGGDGLALRRLRRGASARPCRVVISTVCRSRSRSPRCGSKASRPRSRIARRRSQR